MIVNFRPRSQRPMYKMIQTCSRWPFARTETSKCLEMLPQRLACCPLVKYAQVRQHAFVTALINPLGGSEVGEHLVILVFLLLLSHVISKHHGTLDWGQSKLT